MAGLPRYTCCRLCGQERKLCDSHLFPRFYWQWMKATGDRYFRNPRQPNLRLQDGSKLAMLCPDCEQRFSMVETPFASKVFEPLMAEPGKHVPYGPFALRFLISLLWRNLAVDLDSSDSPAHLRPGLLPVETEWRGYLLERSDLVHFGRVHLFVTDFLERGGPQYNRYLTRDSDATSMWNGARGLLGYYAKFAKLIVVAELTLFDPQLWVKTLVDGTGGTVHSATMQVRDGCFGDFLVDRALRFEGYRRQGIAGMSSNQQRKVQARVEDQIGRLANSELGRAMSADWLWERSIPKTGRNDPCPCGSGRKYKLCHGT